MTAGRRSFGQASNHGEDAVGDALELGVDLGQRARGFEDVEVAVERNLVADLGFVVVDPGVRRMGQNLALKILFHVLAERDVFGRAVTRCLTGYSKD